MLERLYIQNYALIDKMDVGFGPGLNVITGETGAGKSIMLKGLGLILGKRADKDAIRTKERKIVVEGTFLLPDDELKPLFDRLDLDWEPQTVLRREVTPSGKSRAFVNDTPVRLETLEEVGRRLVDIHSQHQQQLLQSRSFRFDIIDRWGGLASLREQYRQAWRQWQKAQQQWEDLHKRKEQLQAMAEYRAYQVAELEQIDWDTDWDEAERKLKSFENQEEILEKLHQSLVLAQEENFGVADRIRQIIQLLSGVERFDDRIRRLKEQWEEILPQINEIVYDLENTAEEYRMMDMQEKNELEATLNRLFALMQKHRVLTPGELYERYLEWKKESEDLTQLDELLEQAARQRDEARQKTEQLANELHHKRQAVIPAFTRRLNELLEQLGMAHSRIKIELIPSEVYDAYGNEEIRFLLSPDKGRTFGELAKTASGGEMSRIMLAIKYLLASKQKWPTVIFDEIDAGISGEIARKVASMLQEMSRHMQIIVITHLPQTAAKGQTHFKVFKTEKDGTVVSSIKTLNPQERIQEIAEMIEGKSPSRHALEHARHLLETEHGE